MTPGLAQADYSDSCTAPSNTVVDGYAGSAYMKIKVRQVDANHTWVCYRIDAGTPAQLGGRLEITAPAVESVEPSVDGGVNDCEGHYTVPPVEGSIGNEGDPGYVPFLVGAYARTSETWICARLANQIQNRIVIRTSDGTIPNVVLKQDSPATVSPPPATPPAGQPSSGCTGGRMLLNADVGQNHLWVSEVTSAAGDSASICVRSQGQITAGGRLTIDASSTLAGGPHIVPGTDVGICDSSIVHLVSPAELFVGRTSNLGTNASVCVQAGTTKLTLTLEDHGVPVQPSVTWTSDADSVGDVLWSASASNPRTSCTIDVLGGSFGTSSGTLVSAVGRGASVTCGDDMFVMNMTARADDALLYDTAQQRDDPSPAASSCGSRPVTCQFYSDRPAVRGRWYKVSSFVVLFDPMEDWDTYPSQCTTAWGATLHDILRCDFRAVGEVRAI